jgi:hypothetical protein
MTMACARDGCAQVIRMLLSEVERVPEEEMESTLGNRIEFCYIQSENTETANVAGRLRIEREVYSKVANYAALSKVSGHADVPFLHPVGCVRRRAFSRRCFAFSNALPRGISSCWGASSRKRRLRTDRLPCHICAVDERTLFVSLHHRRNKRGATTRVSTTDLFGTRYHMFGFAYTKEALIARVRAPRLHRSVYAVALPAACQLTTDSLVVLTCPAALARSC